MNSVTLLILKNPHRQGLNQLLAAEQQLTSSKFCLWNDVNCSITVHGVTESVV